MRRNADLMFELDASLRELQFSLNILRGQPSALFLYPLPASDRGALNSSCFLAVCGQWCMLADFIATFSALLNSLETELASVFVCPVGVE